MLKYRSANVWRKPEDDWSKAPDPELLSTLYAGVFQRRSLNSETGDIELNHKYKTELYHDDTAEGNQMT